MNVTLRYKVDGGVVTKPDELFAQSDTSARDFIPEGVETLENQGLSQDERDRLIAALFHTSWNKTKAAQKLQWSRMTLYRKMVKYGISTLLKEESGEVTLIRN